MMLFHQDCRTYRATSEANESKFQAMMAEAGTVDICHMNITESPFDGETLQEWLEVCEKEDTSTNYKTSILDGEYVEIVQTSGFEFIYKAEPTTDKLYDPEPKIERGVNHLSDKLSLVVRHNGLWFEWEGRSVSPNSLLVKGYKVNAIKKYWAIDYSKI